MNLFKVKYVYYEREWPERCPKLAEVCWWRKGNEVNGYWYKAENYFGGHTLGDTAEEACDESVEYLPTYWWGLLWLTFWVWFWEVVDQKKEED